MASSLRVRRSGKVLLVNQQQELLLFRATEVLQTGHSREIWFPVGGGAEGDESFAECAARELYEETGLSLSARQLGPVVATRCGAFVLDGVPTWSDEAYFFATIPDWRVDTSGFTELEREQLTGHHWWSRAELATTERVVFPSSQELAALMSQLLNHGPDGSVVELSWENPPGLPRIDSSPHSGASGSGAEVDRGADLPLVEDIENKDDERRGE